MGSRIYTRTGDGGTTSLADGSRIAKTAARVEAYGTVDEANSWIGAARASVTDPLLEAALEFVQHRFYNCSSNLATPPGGSGPEPPGIAAEDVAWLEAAIDRFERSTGPLDHFVVPGGCADAGLLHVARTVVRRAERRIVALAGQEPVDEQVRKFVNRTSDFLFAAARFANHACGAGDVCWDRDLPRPPI